MKINKMMVGLLFLMQSFNILLIEPVQRIEVISHPFSHENVREIRQEPKQVIVSEELHRQQIETAKLNHQELNKEFYAKKQAAELHQQPLPESDKNFAPSMFSNKKSIDFDQQVKEQSGLTSATQAEDGWQLFNEHDFRWNTAEKENKPAEDLSKQAKIKGRAERIIDFKDLAQQQSLKIKQQAQEPKIQESIEKESIKLDQRNIMQAEFDLSKNVLERAAEKKINLDSAYETFYVKTKNNFLKKYFTSKDSPEQAQKSVATANEINERARNLPMTGRQIIVDVWADVKLKESNTNLSKVKKAYAQAKRVLSLQEKVEYKTRVTEKIIKSSLDSIFGVDKYSADSNVKLSDSARNELNKEIEQHQNILFSKSYTDAQRQQAIAMIKDLAINKVTSGIAKFTTTIELDGTYRSEVSSEGITSQSVFDPAGKAVSRTFSVLDDKHQEIKFETKFDPTQKKVVTKMFDVQGNSTELTANGAQLVDQWRASHVATIVAKSTLKAILYGIKMTPYVAYWALTTPHNIKSICTMLAIEISKTSVLTVAKAGSLAVGFGYQEPVMSTLSNRIGASLSGSNRGWMSAEPDRVFRKGSKISNWLNKIQGKPEPNEAINPDEEYYTCMTLVRDTVGHIRPQENAYLYGPISFDPLGFNSLAPRKTTSNAAANKTQAL